MAKKLRFFYDAPLSINFVLVCMSVLLLARFLSFDIIAGIFSAPAKQGSVFAFDWKSPFNYLRLFIHVLGHRDWAHFTLNAAFVLLLGPVSEKRYGSAFLFFMTAIAAFITGVLNAALFGTPVCGADGIVFLLLASTAFANVSAQGFPLTHVLLFTLYLANRLFVVIDTADFAPLIHIAGGLCVSIFIFTAAPANRRRASLVKN